MKVVRRGLLTAVSALMAALCVFVIGVFAGATWNLFMDGWHLGVTP